MKIFCLVLIFTFLVACAKTNERPEYNPLITIVRVTTGNIK